MSGLRISAVSKSFGQFAALRDIDLDFDSGELVTFLGPSGCGKTTLLRIVSGLETADTGQIVLKGEDVTYRPTHLRNIGMVFQSLAMFPHLTVAENIAYGLRLRGMSREKSKKRVGDLLELVQLPGIENNSVSTLSGGQKQRVAIARALALEPDLFLLDEPMSALDANLRDDMQIELRKLQQSLGVTTIVVTHDQTEAMTLSDTIVVLGNTCVQQVGSPIEIYKMPKNRFVAEFVGAGNFLLGVLADRSTVTVGGESFRIGSAAPDVSVGASVTVLCRPEELVVVQGDETVLPNSLPAKVTFIRDIGHTVEILLDLKGQELLSIMAPRDCPDVRVGQDVNVRFPPEHCRAMLA